MCICNSISNSLTFLSIFALTIYNFFYEEFVAVEIKAGHNGSSRCLTVSSGYLLLGDFDLLLTRALEANYHLIMDCDASCDLKKH